MQFAQLKRREFITLLGAVAAWPLAARAQQPAMPVIGFLDSGSPHGMTTFLAAFHRGLGETGYTKGKNVAIDHRWARRKLDRLPDLAAELVRRQVAVIAATRGPAPGLAAKAITSTIPIVFQTGSDPVQDGLVASLSRPGGNLTGATRLTTDLIPKRVGVILELKSNMRVVATLVNPLGPQAEDQLQEMQRAARMRGLQLLVFNASVERDLEPAFRAIAQSKAEALIVATNPLFVDRRDLIASLAMNNAIPTIFGERELVAAGGLMSYAASLADSFRQVGVYVGRILNGKKPADLPVLQPTKFDLIINLKTAKAIGLTIPPKLLALADEAIE